jgi:hypothetical protein
MDIADIERATEPELDCVADVPAEEWEKYEERAREEGEPPSMPIDPKELV